MNIFKSAWIGAGLLVAAFTVTAANAAPILQGTATSLTGINGLVIGGNTYSATFVDGTCASVYGACDAAHFTFHTPADALAAATAILSAVAGTYFDTHPGSTVGCENVNDEFCFVLTPYSIAGSILSDAVFANFYTSSPPDSASNGTLDPANVFNSTGEFLVWAVFTPSATSVPEPVTLSLFGAGLAGAVAIRRKKKAAAK